MSKVWESLNNFYSTGGSKRPMTTNSQTQRGRIISTGDAVVASNTVSNFRPSSGLFARSSSSSFRNTKGKLQNLSESLNYLLDDCKQTRTNTKALQLHLNFLKEELPARGLDLLNSSLGQDIKLLQKSMMIAKRSDMLRFDALHQTCQGLHRNTKQIKGKLHQISQKMLAIQNVLGYHGLREKLRY